MALIGPNKGNQVVIRLTANATLNVVANSTFGNNDIGSGEALRGATISYVFFSTGGNIKISRGSNLMLTLVGSDHWDLASQRAKLTEDSSANINVAFNDTNSSLVMIVSKIYDGGQNPDIAKDITS